MESSVVPESPIERNPSTSRGKWRTSLSTRRKSRSLLMRRIRKAKQEKCLISSSSCFEMMMGHNSNNTPLVFQLEERTVKEYQTEADKENSPPAQIIDNNQRPSHEAENMIDSAEDEMLAVTESHHLDFFSANVSDTIPSLLIEKESCKEATNESTSLSGQRLFDPKYLFDQIQKIDHSPFSCTFRDMKFLKEIRNGFSSVFKFKCLLCGVIEKLECNKNENKINQKVVQGTVCSGSGFAQLDEFCGFIDMPCMSKNLFSKENTALGNVLKDMAYNSMLEAGREEMQIAISKGHIDTEGIPYITVVTDGSWGKRSYKTNYNSLSGVACIIGYETRKVLFLGIRNAYCSICAIATNKNKEPAIHCCFKNWNGSSTAMEPDGIAEGFKCSIQMHGLKYTQIIGDGDSSVMNILSNILPYGHSTFIKKTECSNHLLRNFSAKLIALTKKTENKFGSVPITLRRKLEKNIMALRRAIKGASNHSRKTYKNISDQIESLQCDIKNSPCHVFGDHSKCQKYYCKGPKSGEENIVPELKKCGLWYDMYLCIAPILNNVESVLQEKNNNLAEHFNAIVAKFIGGKRVNYSLRGSYEARCNAAATKYNTGNLLQSLQKVTECSSKLYSQKFVLRAQNKTNYQRKRRASY